ncbi:hypothetical protein FSHL1_009850 [Fusarium sambucinum]
MDTPTNYATLSHCWGLKKFLTLNKSNISEFSKRIPFNSLTKTFREAINIARSLGFKYIWIDSLCIIQDDALDWKCESARMGSVYGRSGLNIAATGAPSGESGCWLPQDEAWRCKVSLGKDGPYEIIYECITEEKFRPKEEDLPLMKRAWVLQELFLAPRTLHFTRNQVFWACQSTTKCEIFPSGLPRGDKMFSSSLGLPPGLGWFSCSGWRGIVERYTCSNITFGRDKLVAISSIAQLIHKDTDNTYVVGKWRNDLMFQLCWVANPGKRYAPATAPSWSWASNSGLIDYSGDGSEGCTKLYIEIQDINIDYVTPSNPFGEVLGGILYLRCEYLIECTVHASMECKGIVIDEERKFKGKPRIDDMHFDDFGEHAGNDTFRAFWLPLTCDSEYAFAHTGIVLQPTEMKKGE